MVLFHLIILILFKNIYILYIMSEDAYGSLSKEQIDNFWKFIKNFKPVTDISAGDYRQNLIKRIKKKYTIEQFYENEKILGDLFLKLRIKYTSFIKEHNEKEKLEESIRLNSSNSHKALLYHEKSKQLYVNRYKSALRILGSLLEDRENYENAMMDTNFIKKYAKTYEGYYYSNDYPFPNVNYVFYNDNSKKLWIKNIKRLYYVKNAEKNWYTNPYLSVDVDKLIL
jgi:hypothetical protein